MSGTFWVFAPGGTRLCIISSDGSLPEEKGWEHVSVSAKKRTPTWEEMCFVKDAFWSEEEIVFQLHPKRSEYVNNHPNVLHLWRNVGQDPPLPPSILVGIKGFVFQGAK
jgi:hypothetical protein